MHENKTKARPRRCPRNASIAGMVVGRLTALREVCGQESVETGKRLWVCRCECGAEVVAPRRRILSGSARSCGCLRKNNPGLMAPRKIRSDLTGLSLWGGVVTGHAGRVLANGHFHGSKWTWTCPCGRAYVRSTQSLQRRKPPCPCTAHPNGEDLRGREFGHLMAIRRIDDDARGRPVWLCLCDCTKLKPVRSSLLLRKSGQRSCGCLITETAQQRARTFRGPGNPNWNPDRDEVKRQEERYGSTEGRKWAGDVVRRDRKKCVRCGSRNRPTAHHKDGWAWCKERRFDVSNGATLCYNCHSEFHSTYGTGKNTERQFVEFMQQTRMQQPLFATAAGCP